MNWNISDQKEITLLVVKGFELGIERRDDNENLVIELNTRFHQTLDRLSLPYSQLLGI